ncbi:MAG: hypothetical protein JNK95_04230 [Candidatus Competibacter sp.]|nr:hypothetical protein [Candidatus Competibacter sp.]MDG4606480.1 hypothetical protein [Candidatus Contendobacter sp.]MDS4059268.1 hypothetical protein [Candidatus Contendobacter sp.]HRD49765.1 hypothetical protein [Candidatus Contendobacter sp.]
MTTRTFTTPIDHTADAGFRAWAQELSNELIAAGLVRMADSGQMNFGSVTRPAINTAGGYEIFRFNDALQGTAPIVIKIEYGTGVGATFPAIWITAGSGSNGSGTLTGTVTPRQLITWSGALSSVVTSYPTYLCVAPAHLGLAWKLGAASSNGYAFLSIARHHDPAGAATGNGFVMITHAGGGATNLNAHSVRTAAPAVAYAVTTALGIAPGQPTSSVVGADIQAYALFAINPRVWTIPTLAAVLLAEVPANATCSVAMVGSTPRTLLSIGNNGFYPLLIGTGPAANASYGLAMLWE